MAHNPLVWSGAIPTIVTSGVVLYCNRSPTYKVRCPITMFNTCIDDINKQLDPSYHQGIDKISDQIDDLTHRVSRLSSDQANIRDELKVK